MAATLTRSWRWVVLRGIAALLFGMLTLFNPGITLAVLVLWFGAFALVDGVFMVASALVSRRDTPHWIALLIGGLLGIAVGVGTFLVPGVTALLLLALIAVWAIVIGVAETVAAIRLRREITGGWMFVVAGLLAVAFGVIMIVTPTLGALAVLLWIGAYAVVSGILLLVLGVRLRGRDRTQDRPSAPLAF